MFTRSRLVHLFTVSFLDTVYGDLHFHIISCDVYIIFVCQKRTVYRYLQQSVYKQYKHPEEDECFLDSDY